MTTDCGQPARTLTIGGAQESLLMNSTILEAFLERSGVVIIDGALATELERRGADLTDALWSAKLLIEQPDLICQVHYDYFLAGADVAITASYQATFEGFARRGLSTTEAADLMRRSVTLACEAREKFWAVPANRRNRERPLVAASIGSYGAYLADGSEYRGDYGLTVEELMDFHRNRMAVLMESDADLLACETIPCRIEGEALVRLLTEFPGAAAWLSFSCCDEHHVCQGDRFADCARLANGSSQVLAVGVNCTPPRFVAKLLASARDVTDKPLLVYPNSGEAWDAEGRCWVAGTGVTEFGKPAKLWRDAGGQLIGGCCKTGPDDIAAIAQALRDDKSDARQAPE
jgi:homocysteine S-methyltransferase